MLIKENRERIREDSEKASRGEKKTYLTLYHPMFPKFASPAITCAPSITTSCDSWVALRGLTWNSQVWETP